MKKILIVLLTAFITFGFIACNPDIPKTETSGTTGTIPTISSPQDVISIIEIIQNLFGDDAEEYTITYYDQGGSTFSGTHATGYPTKHTSGKDTTLLGATKNGYIFDGWFTDSDCSGTAITKLGADDYTEDITLYAKWTTVNYIDEKSVSKTPSGPVTRINTNATSSLTLGASGKTTWYLVSGTITAPGIICTGNVNIILENGCCLTSTGAEKKAGIRVSGTVTSLTIYAQTTETTMGKLIAQGGNDRGAGIGGENSSDYGKGQNITINGGDITATGGTNGAGIGGGRQEGDTIVINNGKVTATGGAQSAGIGGGSGQEGKNITINGGTVTAKGSSNDVDGGYSGAGIGGGCTKDGSYISINGGTVTAIGGYNGNCGAAGIGGGNYGGAGKNITINGGSVTATGGIGGDGIGNGYNSSASSNIKVSNDYQICAGDSANPTTEITHDSDTDLSNSDNLKKQYVVIKQKEPV